MIPRQTRRALAAAYGRVSLEGVAAAVVGSTDGSIRAEVGVADGARVGSAGLLGVRDSPVRGLVVGREVMDSDGIDGAGDAEGVGDTDGVGDAA